MQLTKDVWNENDIAQYRKYLLSFGREKDKCEWEKRIVNTQLTCIAVPSTVVGDIVSQISKGNVLSFVEFWTWNNFTEVNVLGKLICKIKDFDTFKKYLIKYANQIDNWANCDCLKFAIKQSNAQDYFELANLLISSEKPFVKRVGLNILFKMIGKFDYLSQTFKIINTFQYETDYYVNMMLAWIVCECFIKYRDQTLEFLKSHKLNKFVINKAISKCRDSFRVCNNDKQLLLTYKTRS